MSINSNFSEIIYLGPEGTYSQIAAEEIAKKYNLQGGNFKSICSIKAIIDYADKNDNVAAVVPIENSIEGIVRETIDNLTFVKDERLKISAEFVLPINNCLLTKNKISLKDVNTIVSYTQPLAQCRNFIVNNFPHDINIREIHSTAQAAKSLLTAPDDWAAIANKKAAEIYELNVLAENINDTQNNKTRFVVLSKIPTKITNSDKTGIVFSTSNIPGALWNVLNVFKKFEINLTYIDSRPSAKNLKEYNFYVDFEGHILDERITCALKELKQFTTFFRHNGSYKKFIDN